MLDKDIVDFDERPLILVDDREGREYRLSTLLSLADKNEVLNILVGSSVLRENHPSFNKSYRVVGTYSFMIATTCTQKLAKDSYFGLFDFNTLFLYKNSDLLSTVNSKLLIQTRMLFNEAFFNVNRSKTLSKFLPNKQLTGERVCS